MSREEFERLLGGYATDNLTDEQHRGLLEAALDDQSAFDALAAEMPLRELLADPNLRDELLAATVAQEPALLVSPVLAMPRRRAEPDLAAAPAPIAAAPQSAPRPKPRRFNPYLIATVAASLVLTLGIGWFARNRVAPGSTVQLAVRLPQEDAAVQRPALPSPIVADKQKAVEPPASVAPPPPPPLAMPKREQSQRTEPERGLSSRADQSDVKPESTSVTIQVAPTAPAAQARAPVAAPATPLLSLSAQVVGVAEADESLNAPTNVGTLLPLESARPSGSGAARDRLDVPRPTTMSRKATQPPPTSVLRITTGSAGYLYILDVDRGVSTLRQQDGPLRPGSELRLPLAGLNPATTLRLVLSTTPIDQEQLLTLPASTPAQSSTGSFYREKSDQSPLVLDLPVSRLPR